MNGPGQDVVFACTFTATPLVDGLRAELDRLRLPATVTRAPYGQVVETAASATASTLVLVVRPADLIQDQAVHRDRDLPTFDETHEPTAAVRGRAERWMASLTKSVGDRVSEGVDVIVVVMVDDVCVDPHDAALRMGHVEYDPWPVRTARQLADQARAAGARIVEVGPAEYQSELDLLAHIPYRVDVLEGIGRLVGAAVRPPPASPVKVIVTDCDDTLWGGSCAELGPDGIEQGGAYARVQDALVAQRAAGRVVCVASHNHDGDVLTALAGAGPLGLDHLSARRVGWQPKSAMIKEIVSELDLGLCSVVFLDDNVVQRAEVRHVLPEVWVPDFGSVEELADLLEVSPRLNTAIATAEDLARATRYADARVRYRQSRTMDLAQFLRSLDVHVEARPIDPACPDESDLDRAEQLLERTNQFAHASPGFSVRDFVRRSREGRESRLWLLEVEDQIGGYGRVALVADSVHGDVLHVDAVLMSCRVLGRGVEDCLRQLLVVDAHRYRATSVRMDLDITDRNGPMRQFVRDLGGVEDSRTVRLNRPVAEMTDSITTVPATLVTVGA